MLTSVEAALAHLLAGVRRLPSELVQLDAAAGRTLAESVQANRDQPPFNASVMDGYALHAASTPGELRIVGESAAGRALQDTLRAGEAVRISTGAPLPEGADAVLAQEEARVTADILTSPKLVPQTFVRRRGGDFRAGDILLPDARIIDANAIALLAGAGVAKASVTRAPIVRIIANGDELVEPGGQTGASQVFDSASYAVSALARDWGAIAYTAAPLRDDERAILAAATHALSDCDILVIIGGASVGPHDHVRPAMTKLGAEMLVQGIAVRPGRPTWFARAPNGAYVLGLPGNPASALVCARLFLAALIEAMLSGAAKQARASEPGILTGPMAANGARESYVRAIVGERGVTPIADEDSSLMSVLARSNCLVRRVSNAVPAGAGDQVQLFRWSRQ